MEEIIHRHRFIIIEPLYHVTARMFQEIDVLFLLHTLGNRLHVKRLCNLNDCLYDSAVLRVKRFREKLPVDLQSVQQKAGDDLKRGIPASKSSSMQTNPRFLNPGIRRIILALSSKEMLSISSN